MKKKEFKPIISFHPGVTLRKKLGEMGMSVEEFAKRIGEPEKTIQGIVRCVYSVDERLATSLEMGTGIPVHFWLAKQKNYNEYLSRKV